MKAVRTCSRVVFSSPLSPWDDAERRREATKPRTHNASGNAAGRSLFRHCPWTQLQGKRHTRRAIIWQHERGVERAFVQRCQRERKVRKWLPSRRAATTQFSRSHCGNNGDVTVGGLWGAPPPRHPIADGLRRRERACVRVRVSGARVGSRWLVYHTREQIAAATVKPSAPVSKQKRRIFLSSFFGYRR